MLSLVVVKSVVSEQNTPVFALRDKRRAGSAVTVFSRPTNTGDFVETKSACENAQSGYEPMV